MGDFFVHQWHMPLFFFIAGSATWFSLKFRSPMQYVGDRFARLLIPFIFGILILVPPQVYYKLLNHQEYLGSFLQFYPQFFHGILQYASPASYPFYLLHQTVLVSIAFYVVQWNLGIPKKFLIISSARIFITGALYEILIKHLNISQILFGLKPIDMRTKP